MPSLDADTLAHDPQAGAGGPCTWKRRYPDWLTAEGEAVRLMDDLRAAKLKRLKGGTVWAYPCGDHYHIGHQPLWRGSTYPSPASP